MSTDILLSKFLELLSGVDLWSGIVLAACGLLAWWLIGEYVFKSERRALWRIMVVVVGVALMSGELLVHRYLRLKNYVFPRDIAGILVLKITGDDKDGTFQRRLVSSLNAELTKESDVRTIEVRGVDEEVDERALGVKAAHQQARKFGNEHRAQLVLWGTEAGEGRFFARVTIVDQAPASVLRSGEQTLQVQNVGELNLPSGIVTRPVVLARLSAGVVLLREGDFKGSLGYLEPALSLSELEGDDRAPLQIFAGLDHLYLGASAIGGESDLREAIADFSNAGVWYKGKGLLDRWALTQAWLGEVYGYCCLRWQHSDDLDNATASYRGALTYFNEDNEGELWAQILNNTGALYTHCPVGNFAEHMKAAIPALTSALRFHSQRGDAVNWAMVCHNLGEAYRSIPTGDDAENVRTAIRFYESALLVYDKDTSPLMWASIQNGIGLAYGSLTDGNDIEEEKEAIKRYKAALEVLAESTDPEVWAMVQWNMGQAYAALGSVDNGLDAVPAIDCLNSALRVLTREKSPYWWARVEDALGNAYMSLSNGNGGDNVRKGIAICQTAGDVLDEVNYPRDWATVQSHLAWAYSHAGFTSILNGSSEAVAHYQNALRVFKESDYPYEWVSLQIGISAAYLDLSTVTNRDENVESSRTAAQEVLRVCTETKFPQQWAEAQCNLGNAYRMLTCGDPVDNETIARESYEAGLRVFKKDRFPKDWALTQINLGLLYLGAHSGQRVDNLTKAVDFMQSGASVCMNGDCGEIWAHAEFTLGMAFAELYNEQKIEGQLGIAEICFEESLQVYTLEEYPRMWSSAHSALSLIYSLRYAKKESGGNVDDLLTAKMHLEKAVSVDTSINLKGEREAELVMLQAISNELAKVDVSTRKKP
jgi:tetratricopeptide (TPR) repeat protein